MPIPSPSPCGRGQGEGFPHRHLSEFKPSPYPLPQGEGEEFIFVRRFILAPMGQRPLVGPGAKPRSLTRIQRPRISRRIRVP